MSTRAESLSRYSLAILLFVSVVVRLPWLSRTIFHCDSWGYAMGGLYQYVSHPPGFFGFCTLGMAVNQFVGDINRSFVLINLVSCSAGIYFCYRLAIECGSGRSVALVVTSVYAFSICTLYFSTVSLSYAVEGMTASLTGLLCHRAIRSGKTADSVWATVSWSVAGAFRPTTTAFLFPLWAFTMWRARQGKRLLLCVGIAVPIVLSWQRANNYLLEAKSGFHGSAAGEFWALQVMMPIEYETADLRVGDNKQQKTPHYHWPFVELSAWACEKAGVSTFSGLGVPKPSLGRALRLSAVQAAKQAFYLVFSIPTLFLLPWWVGVGVRPSSVRNRELRWQRWFFVSWIAPPAAFFVLGHFGSFGYLQVYLAAVVVVSVSAMLGGSSYFQDAEFRRRRAMVIGAVTAAGFAFYCLGRPWEGTSRLSRTLDVVALQYTGPGIRQSYAVARSTMNRPDTRQIDFIPSKDCCTDAQLLEIARKINWMPESHFRNPASRPCVGE